MTWRLSSVLMWEEEAFYGREFRGVLQEIPSGLLRRCTALLQGLPFAASLAN